MSKRAVIRGEVHVSNRDRKALLNRDLTTYQALYMEGRSECIVLDRHTNSYVLFLIGYLSLELVYISAAKIYDRLLPFWHFEIEKEAQDNGLEIIDNTDLEIHEIYENVGRRVVQFSLGIMLFGFIIASWRAFYEDTLDLVFVSTNIPYWLLPLTIVVLLPLGYLGLILALGGEADRNAEIAATIDRTADEKKHDNVLVLVGDKHVEPIQDNLEQRGWNTRKERSTHPIARALRSIQQ